LGKRKKDHRQASQAALLTYDEEKLLEKESDEYR